jgi:hypothetical protein
MAEASEEGQGPAEGCRADDDRQVTGSDEYQPTSDSQTQLINFVTLSFQGSPPALQ